MISPKKKLIAIHHREDIPAFASEAEEHAFWSAHELGDELWDQAEPFAPEELPAPRPAARPVVIRLDDATLKRAKALARRRRMGYQRLIEELVTAHLSETDVLPDRERPKHLGAGIAGDAIVRSEAADQRARGPDPKP